MAAANVAIVGVAPTFPVAPTSTPLPIDTSGWGQAVPSYDALDFTVYWVLPDMRDFPFYEIRRIVPGLVCRDVA